MLIFAIIFTIIFVSLIVLRIYIRVVRRRRLRQNAAQHTRVIILNRGQQPAPVVCTTEADMNAFRINAPAHPLPKYDQVLTESSVLPPAYTEAIKNVPTAPTSNEVVLKIQP